MAAESGRAGLGVIAGEGAVGHIQGATVVDAAAVAAGNPAIGNHQVQQGQRIATIDDHHLRKIISANGDDLSAAVNRHGGVDRGQGRAKRDRAANAEGDGVCAASARAVGKRLRVIPHVGDRFAQRALTVSTGGIEQTINDDRRPACARKRHARKASRNH